MALTSDGARGWAEALHEAAAHEAWEPMYFCGLSRVRDAEERNRPARREAARAVAEAALFLGSYFKAYFRSGQFLDVAIDPKEAETTLVDELKSRLGLGEADARALAKKLLAEISLAPGADGKAHLLTKLSGGFVTRGGNTLAFPGMDVTITPFASSPVAVSRIDLSAVGADVVRVFIEAVGDSLSGVPGVLQSTGCSTRDPSAEPLLACFDPTGTVSADAFAAIDARANSVDGMVGHAVGSAVRGASWFSLNNEALAKVIETAAAAVARKATEKVAWCYQACKDSAARDGLRGVPWEQELTVQLKFRR